MAPLNVLVVGASIAGPATAYWLSRMGARVTVIERFPSLRTGGQAVDIRTCGVTVMRKMGIESLINAQNTGEEGISFVRDDGRPYGVIRTTGDSDRQGIISEYEIYRGALSRILCDMTKDHPMVEYRFGEEIASMAARQDQVEVEFKSGTPKSTYDLIVACDGAFSRTRAMALGCRVRDHVHPTNLWAAYYTTSKDYLGGSKVSHGISAPGGRFINVGPDTVANKGKVLIMVNSPGSSDKMESYRKATSGGTDQLKSYIAAEYSDLGWITPDLIQEMQHSDDFYSSEIVQVKCPALYAGRVVFVGDAGYASGPTGGGTSLALTGAYILAGELARTSGDPEAGLRAYSERMAPIIEELQVIPPLASTIMAPQTAWGISIRNWMFGFIAWTGLAEVLQRYLGPAFADTKEYPVPEYEWKEDLPAK